MSRRRKTLKRPKQNNVKKTNFEPDRSLLLVVLQTIECTVVVKMCRTLSFDCYCKLTAATESFILIGRCVNDVKRRRDEAVAWAIVRRHGDVVT